MSKVGSNHSIATPFVTSGAAGAESRHARLIERLRAFGFDVDVDTLDIRAGKRPGWLPVAVFKLLGGLKSAIRQPARSGSFVAFDPYAFCLGSIVARIKGNQPTYFCRNDQIYQTEEIARHFGRKPKIAKRLFLLQLVCAAACTRYVVQSQFAKQNLADRFAGILPKLGKKIFVLRNDNHVERKTPVSRPVEGALRIGFISNAIWEKKGFPIVASVIEASVESSANLQFSVFGAGEAFDRLRSGLSAEGRERTQFHGYLDGIEKMRDLVDVVFVPTVADHFPNVLIECAAIGLPMVLSDIEAHRNIFPQHSEFFPLTAPSSEICERLVSLRPEERRLDLAQQQQSSISRLDDAWGAPLLAIFETDDPASAAIKAGGPS